MAGIAAGLITAKHNGQLNKQINKGKSYVEKLAATRTVELKKPTWEDTRVTGQEEAEFWKALAKQMENDPEFRRAVSK